MIITIKRNTEFGLIVITFTIQKIYKFKKKYGQFNGEKTKIISAPLVSIDYLDFSNVWVLSVGPLK